MYVRMSVTDRIDASICSRSISMSRDPVSAGSADSRTAAFDFTPNSFLKSLSACLKECMVSFISRNCDERYESLSFIRWCSTARTDMATTTEAPRRNRQTDEAIARTGSRMLTGFVRLWGTSRIVTGVRSRLRNNPRSVHAGSLRDGANKFKQ